MQNTSSRQVPAWLNTAKRLVSRLALPLALVATASTSTAMVVSGGQTLNINTRVTGNNDDLHLFSGTVNLNPGGIIGNGLVLFYEDSVANFLGGTIENHAYLNNGVLNVLSGHIKNDIAVGVSWWANGHPMGLGQVNIYGGSFTNTYGVNRYLNAVGNGRFDVYGGDFADVEFLAQQSGDIYIYGSNFNYQAGEITDVAGRLTGTLNDGQAIDVPFQRYGQGAIHLVSAATVPEPASLGLVLMALMASVVFRSVVTRTSAALGLAGRRSE